MERFKHLLFLLKRMHQSLSCIPSCVLSGPPDSVNSVPQDVTCQDVDSALVQTCSMWLLLFLRAFLVHRHTSETGDITCPSVQGSSQKAVTSTCPWRSSVDDLRNTLFSPQKGSVGLKSCARTQGAIWQQTFVWTLCLSLFPLASPSVTLPRLLSYHFPSKPPRYKSLVQVSVFGLKKKKQT